ncbi:class I SAM-dependent methyltransferase [Nostoc sp. PA-18-2419]|uniref:class I SAM-dependent methyltransferase n=1 Tax=Nostoc sp. PA-18-2419 TaxID=2575443 RepID=UPI001108CEE3|nr:class I SAM-dependent methyltransferase [Nostoc sp. PA-18-2419]
MTYNLTYEESIQWIRNQSEHKELVKFCYLDTDNLAAAKRFSLSEEFIEVANLLKLNNSPHKLKILDLGCGNGIASYAFASLGHDVSSVDPHLSEDVGLGATARLASTIKNGSIETFQAFAELLPFPDSTFDIVYVRQALHHFYSLPKGLAECSRVLKPKGLLLATREHVVDNDKQLKIFLENHIFHRINGGENAYTLNVYISNFKNSGFKILKNFTAFSTVINHFPTSNIELMDYLFQPLKKILGKKIASVIIKFYPIEILYRYLLSYFYKYPGRLYSFLCIKEKNS